VITAKVRKSPGKMALPHSITSSASDFGIKENRIFRIQLELPHL
jgi:hypothetical protein